MKTLKLLFAFVVIGALQSCCFNGSCDDEEVVITEPSFESVYEPIYLTREVFEERVQLLPPKPIVNSGKIYVLNNLLFVNEKNEGFHVYINDDPSNPMPINFIEVPGSTDISIRNGVYYINQAVDLIAITYNSRSSELNVSKRIEDVFPVLRSPDGFYGEPIAGSIIVGWQLKTND